MWIFGDRVLYNAKTTQQKTHFLTVLSPPHTSTQLHNSGVDTFIVLSVSYRKLSLFEIGFELVAFETNMLTAAYRFH
ncbi:MAG TPA: hypothetical protein DCE42_11040 [Myxococcales bacterium]|nr:hypothetical protein [Deltaproteobacteria bacterium]HAA55283.1 hypothetical protein [Myxococcales bacterium]